MPKLNKSISEPSILVKPVSKFGGLDNIHITLMILVVILVLLLAAISYNTKITVINGTISGNNCTYGSANGTCLSPVHNATQIRLYAEKALAGYSSLNSSLSILPFISNVSEMSISYLPNSKDWFVTFPYTSPGNSSKTYTYSFLIRDSNLSLQAFSQSINTPSISQNYVVSSGVIKMAQQTSCSFNKPLQVYWFVDPYSPAGVQSLITAVNLQQRFGTNVNLTIKALFTQYSSTIAKGYGLNNTLSLEKYILCGSTQKNFSGFAYSLNASYANTYMPAYILQGIAERSGFNISSLNSCIAASQSAINAQALLAKYYNISSSSSVITDCQYISLPETAGQAICYANSTLCR